MFSSVLLMNMCWCGFLFLFVLLCFRGTCAKDNYFGGNSAYLIFEEGSLLFLRYCLCEHESHPPVLSSHHDAGTQRLQMGATASGSLFFLWCGE